MLCWSALHDTTQHTYCKILQQKNSNAWKQSNQSHPPSSIQVISQRGCHFTLANIGIAKFFTKKIQMHGNKVINLIHHLQSD
jgi:hypothetical protein